MNDWEGDTIRTTPAKGRAVTLVDRKSRFLVAKGVDSVSSQKVYDAIKEAFNEKGIHPKMIVFDNGSEFAKFRELEQHSGLQFILQTFTVHGNAALTKI